MKNLGLLILLTAFQVANAAGTLPTIPSDCFNKENYCLRKTYYAPGLFDKNPAWINVKFFARFPKSHSALEGKTRNEIIDRYMALDKWDDYVAAANPAWPKFNSAEQGGPFQARTILIDGVVFNTGAKNIKLDDVKVVGTGTYKGKKSLEVDGDGKKLITKEDGHKWQEPLLIDVKGKVVKIVESRFVTVDGKVEAVGFGTLKVDGVDYAENSVGTLDATTRVITIDGRDVAVDGKTVKVEKTQLLKHKVEYKSSKPSFMFEQLIQEVSYYRVLPNYTNAYASYEFWMDTKDDFMSGVRFKFGTLHAEETDDYYRVYIDFTLRSSIDVAVGTAADHVEINVNGIFSSMFADLLAEDDE